MKKLEKLIDINTNGWDINFAELLTPKRNISPYIFLHDKFIESADNKYSCLHYTIFEMSYGAYSGLIGIFKDKRESTLLLNPKDQWFYARGNNSINFCNDLLIARLVAFHNNDKLSGIPFVVFDLNEKTFCFIDFNFTSIYYSIEVENKKKVKLNLDSPDDMKIYSQKDRTGEIIDLSTLKKYSFDECDTLKQLYWEEKTTANKTI